MIAFALNLAGAVALLLWAVRLIRSGVERGYMAQLRNALRRAGQSRSTALMGGAGAAFFLQSSTAVAILATAFATSGVLVPSAGLTLLLGADVGSAIVAQVLIFPAHALIPLLLLIGAGLFLKAKDRPFKEAGRILIGLALVFISLGMIRTATAPLGGNVIVEMTMSYLARDLVSAFVIGGLLAWAMHSSIAAILTFVTIVAEGVLPVPAAVAMVLGANLGGALIPLVLSLSASRKARMIVIGNVLLRGGAAAIVLALYAQWMPPLELLGNDPHRKIINLHLLFNIAVMLLSLPLVPGLIRLLDRLLPNPASHQPAAIVSALDESVIEAPDRALACASREVLRMGETVHRMLQPSMTLFRSFDPTVVKDLLAQEDQVDRMHFETKLYVARLQQRPLTEDQSQRAMDIASFANNLEEAADQLSTNLLELAKRLNEKGLSFSDDGWQDLTDFHDRVLSNAQLALDVMMTRDAATALQLVEEKDHIRQAEQDLQARHLSRLRSGNPASVETSNIHQETLRALKTINTSFSTMAYPIAEEVGALLSSRLSKAASGR
jgi:phosphate:Na+ symporter